MVCLEVFLFLIDPKNIKVKDGLSGKVGGLLEDAPSCPAGQE